MAPSLTTTTTSSPPTSLPTKQAPPPTSKPREKTDPSIYDIHHQKFTSDDLPQDSSAWLQRARAVSEILSADAAARDIANFSPVAEVALLKSSGLLKVLGPAEYGGGGQNWEIGYQVIREVAKGDGSIGMLLGYHLLWSTTANVVGTDEQKARFQKLIIEGNFFVGGLRLTESGSVKIGQIKVPWEDALGWDVKTKKPDPKVLSIPFATLLLPTIHSTRAWPYGGDNKNSATEEFYILERYGNFYAHLQAAVALTDRAGSAIANVYTTHGEKREISARERGEVAEVVASAKIVTTDTALRVTAGVFEVTGARATGRKVGLDRFWRDVRTHSLHDPVAYKNREVGEYALLDKIPEPTWYT
ncbi:putative Dibenzothiophene desulfurization enzyme C [Glarea lozoyensis 74030]|uniref:Putative Dibenzothiophene desulfurization enzyme C n=1 Tax=Glarea lozoyensis (strain ATCC 74030 / MF5533) TaxID=1104152 RepID=H0EVM9_GLAL7|nr:putative Dibenzothiophene desulfurization enzyme C [Glarea lozoyensis 74030]